MSKTYFEFFISMYIFGYTYGKGRDISSQIYKVECDESHKRSKNKMLKYSKEEGNCIQFGDGDEERDEEVETSRKISQKHSIWGRCEGCLCFQKESVNIGKWQSYQREQMNEQMDEEQSLMYLKKNK